MTRDAAVTSDRALCRLQTDALVAEMTVAVCGVIQSRSPGRLVRAAVTTLVTITSTVRSGTLVDCPHIQRLYGRAGQMQLQKQVRVGWEESLGTYGEGGGDWEGRLEKSKK